MRQKMLKDVLKAARTKLNLKQSEVAKLIGITTQTYLKWENGHSEPKASQVGKLAISLKITEKEICQGETNKSKMEPLDFMRKVGVLISQVPQTEMLIAMHEYINDADGFIKKVTEPHDIADFEISKQEAEMILDVIGAEPIDGESDKNIKAREHILTLLKGAS